MTTSKTASLAMHYALSVMLLVACGMCGIATAADDAPIHLVDLTAAVNRAMEDDGTAGNGEGGWTDEGINDMYVYPAIPSGEVRRNGHVFQIDAGRRVIMLRGRNHHSGFAESVTVEVPPVTGRYVYVLHHSAGFAAPTGETVATYTLRYADGTTAARPIKQKVDILPWWTGQWFDNLGPKSWPIFMGRNSYSRKWHQYIGVWAMRWENPHPEKAIVGLTFVSAGKATPVIWAVTVTDQDFHADEAALKADFKRPEEGDDAYFEPKMAMERQAIFARMQADGWAQGIIRIETLAPDLLAVTLDAAASGGPGEGATLATALQATMAWQVESAAGGMQPAKVGRDSVRSWSGDIGPFPMNHLYQHTYYLQLPRALVAGETYTVRVAGLPPGTPTATAVWTPDSLAQQTPALKVNQHGYAPQATQRYAYLGWWAAELGAVDHSAFATAELRDAGTPERVVARLPITPRAGTGPDPRKPTPPDQPDPASGELLRQIDLSSITVPGRYFLHVPGLGRSVDFAITGEATLAAARTVSRSLLHQRCGCELTPESTPYPRPACHLHTYRSGRLVGGIDERYEGGERVQQNAPVDADDPVREFAGGYHDAADYDLFYYHFLGTADMLTAYEFGGAAVRGLDLNLPERESPLPDLLDEAIWALKFYTDTQAADGAVNAGRGNDEDYIRKNWPSEWAKDLGRLPAYGILPPCQQSSASYAAVAAQLARCLQPIDAPLAADYSDRAIRAFDWAARKPETPYQEQGPSYIRLDQPYLMLWAAAELYKTTGDARFHQAFLERNASMDVMKISWRQRQRLALYLWPYASAEGADVDVAIRQTYRDAILKEAQLQTQLPDRYGYRLSAYRMQGGWGDLAGGARVSMSAMRAWLLTGDSAYYDAASLNADYQLGANPLSRSYITGLGEHAVRHPLLRATLLHGAHEPVPGISIFGPGGGPKSLTGAYPADRPLWRCWMDDPVSAMHNEFVIERLGREAAFYLLLADGKPITTAPK